MPGVSRQGADAAGGTITAGSSNVFVNGNPAVRIGDPVEGHGRGSHRNPTMSAGSESVLVNGIGVCREGDAATCGHPATGSGDVNAG